MIEPLLPLWPEKSPGPRPVADRLCLQGVLFALCDVIPEPNASPRVLVHRALLAELNGAGRIDWSRAVMDGGHIDAKRALGTGLSSVNRGEPESKHHLITDGDGTLLKVITTGANVPDVSMAVALRNSVPPVACRVGRPRFRFPGPAGRRRLRQQGIWGRMPPSRHPSRSSRNADASTSRASADCATSWTQGIALLHRFRRLAIRGERHLDLHEAFVSLASSLICWRRLIK